MERFSIQLTARLKFHIYPAKLASTCWNQRHTYVEKCNKSWWTLVFIPFFSVGVLDLKMLWYRVFTFLYMSRIDPSIAHRIHLKLIYIYPVPERHQDSGRNRQDRYCYYYMEQKCNELFQLHRQVVEQLQQLLPVYNSRIQSCILQHLHHQWNCNCIL